MREILNTVFKNLLMLQFKFKSIMEKKLLLLVVLFICSNFYAQINQTFVPENGKAYFIKAESQKPKYLSEKSDGTFEFVSFTSAEMSTKTEAQWTIEFVTQKGYTLKNVASNKFFTYNGSGKNGNAIAGAAFSDPNSYFEFRATPNMFEIGAGDLIFSKQGYGVIIPGTNTWALDVFGNTTDSPYAGVWDYNAQQNQSWLFIASEEIPNFEAAMVAGKYPFNPTTGAYYYLMSLSQLQKDPADLDNYVAAVSNGNIELKVISTSEIATHTDAQWYISKDEINEGYKFQNVATNKYFKYDGKEKANGILTADWVAGDESNFVFSMTAGFKYNYGSGAFEARAFAISKGNQALNNYGGGNAYETLGTWGYEGKTNEQWVILSQGQHDLFLAARGITTISENNAFEREYKVLVLPDRLMVEGENIRGIKVFDICGKTILSKADSLTNKEELSLIEFSPGLYIIRIETVANGSFVTKFIKK